MAEIIERGILEKVENHLDVGVSN